MKPTIDAAGRIVIPKALRERAGLTAGTQVDFRFHDGSIEISPAHVEGPSETRHGIDFPVPPVDAPDLTIEQIREVIDEGREQRSDQVSSAGR